MTTIHKLEHTGHFFCLFTPTPYSGDRDRCQVMMVMDCDMPEGKRREEISAILEWACGWRQGTMHPPVKGFLEHSTLKEQGRWLKYRRLPNSGREEKTFLKEKQHPPFPTCLLKTV